MQELAKSIDTLKQEVQILTFINTEFEKEVIRLIHDNTQYSQESNFSYKLISNADTHT